jgi:hypothetical protein
MAEQDRKEKSDKSSAKSCCYHVINDCGCVVGRYCCDDSDMTNCRFESCC